MTIHVSFKVVENRQAKTESTLVCYSHALYESTLTFDPLAKRFKGRTPTRRDMVRSLRRQMKAAGLPPKIYLGEIVITFLQPDSIR